jgi:hypothetical protein
MAKQPEAQMTVRILDKDGQKIAAFDDGASEDAEAGFSPELRRVLLAFHKQYPGARFIDVEFRAGRFSGPTP